MPILPDSVVSAPPAPVTGRRYFAGHNYSREVERPLFANKTRAGLEPEYPRPTGTAHLQPAEPAFQRGADSLSSHVRLYPQLKNRESLAAGDASLAAHTGGKARVPLHHSHSPCADFLAPYGHLNRTGGVRDGEVVVGTYRGGIGYNTQGDKPYREPQQSAQFYSEAKPNKFYADPHGRQAKVTLVHTARPHNYQPGTGLATVEGRPLWQR